MLEILGLYNYWVFSILLMVGFYAVIPGVDFVLAVQSFDDRMELNFCHAGDEAVRERASRVADRVVEQILREAA